MLNTNDDHDLLIRMSTTVESIYTRLFGGEGEKGVLPQHHEDIDGLKAYKNRLTGALTLLSAIVTLLGGTLIYHLFTGK